MTTPPLPTSARPWRAPSLKDADPDAGPPVRCQCGRTVSPRMMSDLRAMPAAVRAQLRLRGRAVAPFICDACREILFATRQIAREDYYRALGAPPETLARVRGYVLRREGLRDDDPVANDVIPSLSGRPLLDGDVRRAARARREERARVVAEAEAQRRTDDVQGAT